MSTITLLPHQQSVIEQTKEQNKVAYYLDMGLGKTFVGSEKMKDLHTGVNLVICQKSKVNDWIEHFYKYYHCHCYNLTKENELKGFLYGVEASEAITKAYYYGWKTAIRIGLYNSKGEIEEIGTVSSGLTDELRADLAENPSKYEGRVVAIQAMSRDKKEHTLRHPFIVQFRDDKPARDCTIEETFS